MLAELIQNLQFFFNYRNVINTHFMNSPLLYFQVCHNGILQVYHSIQF